MVQPFISVRHTSTKLPTPLEYLRFLNICFSKFSLLTHTGRKQNFAGCQITIPILKRLGIKASGRHQSRLEMSTDANRGDNRLIFTFNIDVTRGGNSCNNNDNDEYKISTISSAILSPFISCGENITDVGNGKSEIKHFVLHKICGYMYPHQMTLLLGPPGCGRSLLMKIASGRISNEVACPPGVCVESDIRLNGNDIKSALFPLGGIVDFVDQTDTGHATLLTVEETLRYAWQCTDNTASYCSTEIDKECGDEVARMLSILGLDNCKDTLVGDESIRGISGGEKRRLTLGEMLISPRSIKLMDFITDGLDAAIALSIMTHLRNNYIVT